MRHSPPDQTLLAIVDACLLTPLWEEFPLSANPPNNTHEMFMQAVINGEILGIGPSVGYEQHTPMCVHQLNVPLYQLQRYIKGKVTFVLISCFRLTYIEGFIHASQTMH